MEKLIELYKEWRGSAPLSCERLSGAGSNRAYYRLIGLPNSTPDTQHPTPTTQHPLTVIGCIGTSREENKAFIYLSRHFASKQLPVPEVLAVSNDNLCYLQTDLGSTSLFDAIRAGRDAGGQYNEQERELLRCTIRELPRLQFNGHEGLDYSHCYPQPQFDEEGIFFDLNYFKYCFLKATGIDFHEVRLEADFHALARDLLSEPSASFLYRDFQARNVMIIDHSPLTIDHSPLTIDHSPLTIHHSPLTIDHFASTEDAPANNGQWSMVNGQWSMLNGQCSMVNGQCYFIDFQGGRCGPYYYDLASFLWQASARYPDDLRQELVNEYYTTAQQYTMLPPRPEFDRRLRLFVFFRTLQVLGAYGFRGYFERKQHFIDSIPPALDNLRQLLADGACRYPHLYEVLSTLTANNQTNVLCQSSNSKLSNSKSSRLVVRIFSFSYKKGIPEDESGNGGGYVFDCRSTHNPGRYEEYKKMTGLDEPVIQFLEKDGEILTFLQSVYRLADAHVERYLERGFTSLMFSFGCTGGQHRSVYSAQHLAEHLNKKYGIEVRLCHREQGIIQTLS